MDSTSVKPAFLIFDIDSSLNIVEERELLLYCYPNDHKILKIKGVLAIMSKLSQDVTHSPLSSLIFSDSLNPLQTYKATALSISHHLLSLVVPASISDELVHSLICSLRLFLLMLFGDFDSSLLNQIPHSSSSPYNLEYICKRFYEIIENILNQQSPSTLGYVPRFNLSPDLKLSLNQKLSSFEGSSLNACIFHNNQCIISHLSLSTLRLVTLFCQIEPLFSRSIYSSLYINTQTIFLPDHDVFLHYDKDYNWNIGETQLLIIAINQNIICVVSPQLTPLIIDETKRFLLNFQSSPIFANIDNEVKSSSISISPLSPLIPDNNDCSFFSFIIAFDHNHGGLFLLPSSLQNSSSISPLSSLFHHTCLTIGDYYSQYPQNLTFAEKKDDQPSIQSNIQITCQFTYENQQFFITSHITSKSNVFIGYHSSIPSALVEQAFSLSHFLT